MQNSSRQLRGIWSAIAPAFDLLLFLSMIWHKAPLNKDAPISLSFAVMSLFCRTAPLSVAFEVVAGKSPTRFLK